MPVDFTRKDQKSNISYLKDLIQDHMPIPTREEAFEFLEAIKNDQDAAKEGFLDDPGYGEEIKKYFAHTGEPEKINAGIGYIEYDTDNILLQQIMEALGDLLKIESPCEIIHRLTFGCE